MNKMLVFHITLFVIFSGSLGGMFLYTDAYDNIKATIVDKTCFSCIKMDPVSNLEEFVFKTANGKPHPEFVLNNLTKGPVFLEFRQDVCHACDIIEPIIQKIFNVQFGSKDTFYKTVDYDGTNITFFHIAMDHASDELIESFFIYDKDLRSGVPMHVVITWGDNNGKIQPYYQTGYSLLGKGAAKEQESELRKMITQAVEYYIQNQ